MTTNERTDVDLDREKALAAAHAVREVRDGMLVGLGTGTTAAHAVREIARRLGEGLRITATATSRATEALARSLGIPVVPFDEVARVDLTIDGVDEIDPDLNAVKGGGGALLREKVVAAASDRVIMIADSSKAVARLGAAKLPVEVLPFAAAFAARALGALGAPVVRRVGADGAAYRTDQDAYIFDLAFGRIDDPAALARAIETIPGVIGHGLFLGRIDVAMIAEGEAVRVIGGERRVA